MSKVKRIFVILKLVSTILAVFYTILSFGIDINLHLCHDELKTVHVMNKVDDLDCHTNSHSCSQFPDERDSHNTSTCCSHQQFYLTVDDFQVPINNDNHTCLSLPASFVFIFEYKPEIAEVDGYTFTPPPIIPLYLKEKRFTFYG